jgi:hypothetical protein
MKDPRNAGDNRYGFTIDVPGAASSSELEHAIMLAGGELLERMGLARSAWDGDTQPTKYVGQESVT